MHEQETSGSAIFATMVRAAHQTMDADPKILADPVSLAIATHLQGSSEWAGFKKLSPALFPVCRSALAMRGRYAEDVLEEVSADLTCQYVVLGAGFDTFACRQPAWARRLSICEVDHPATQQKKRAILREAGLTEPANLHFCPIDFEKTSLRDGLSATGFDFLTPAVVSWLGVTQYLSQPAIQSTLEFIRTLQSGTTIVLSFVLKDTELTEGDRQILAEFEGLAEASGEPFLSRFVPSELRSGLLDFGFRSVYHLSPADAEKRYYAHRTDGLHAVEVEQLMRATV